MLNSSDSADKKEEKIKEYALWRGGYPQNEAKKYAEEMRDKMKMNRLQAEMDALNAKMKNDEELSRFDSALESVMPEARSSYEPIRKESDLICLIKDMVEKGVGVERFLPEVSLEYDFDHIHLLSLRPEEILGNEEKKTLAAKLVCAIETLQRYDINITRRITSRNNELFLTYRYPSSQSEYFEVLQKHWEDMFFIAERKGVWSEAEIEKLEMEFKEAITGDEDVWYE